MADDTVTVDMYQEVSPGVYYGISGSLGFLISRDSGRTWQRRNTGFPARILYPFSGNEGVKPLTSFAVFPGNTDRIAAITSSEIYITEDAGLSWKLIPTQDPVKSSAFFTCVSFIPQSPNSLLLGTSFSGLFQTDNQGVSWRELKDSMSAMYRGTGFYEDISGIVAGPLSPSFYLMGMGFGGNFYRSENAGKSWAKVACPWEGANENVKLMYPRKTNGNIHTLNAPATFSSYAVLTNKNLWYYFPEGDRFERQNLPFNFSPVVDMAKQLRLHKAADKFGIYLHAYNCDAESLKTFISFMKTHGLNSLVVDMKDDMGRLTYDTSLPLPKSLNGLLNQVVLEDLVKTAHENGIYVIGRVVVFKDRKLFSYDNYKHALWDFKAGRAWGNFFKVEDEETGEVTWEQREFWLDPFDPFVWDYNIAVARELQDKGIDEIQFDYIRFPSDGDLSTAQYRYRRDGQSKIEALESFLAKARESLTVPLSTDLYGFNCYFRMGNWIGQSVEYFSEYVDVISPMYYPSHFPRDFMQKEQYLPRAKKIYFEGSNRAAAMASGRSLIRPYVQAFLLGGELDFDTATYGNYLIQQLQGTAESDASGFTMWNNSNKYYMVRQSLLEYTKAKNRTTLPPPNAAASLAPAPGVSTRPRLLD